MRILKFGGKSLATPEKMQNVCKYIKKIYKNDKKIIVVVSAVGNTTDSLISSAKTFCGEKLEPRELDVLLSCGETMSSSLFSMTLNSIDVPAKSFQAFQIQLTTFGGFQNSKIAHINKQLINECFENGEVAVIAGFQGINKQNEITTLGRGGSDTTASALAAIFDTDAEIYSDFDGVFCGDPRIASFKKIKKINYRSMIAMAQSGAKVLDARATKIAKRHGFKIMCKSSSEPTKSGSVVSEIESDFISISTQNDLCKTSIHFSDNSKLQFILKNVLNETNNIKIYNLSIENQQINILLKQSESFEFIKNISHKLNILK